MNSETLDAAIQEYAEDPICQGRDIGVLERFLAWFRDQESLGRLWKAVMVEPVELEIPGLTMEEDEFIDRDEEEA